MSACDYLEKVKTEGKSFDKSETEIFVDQGCQNGTFSGKLLEGDSFRFNLASREEIKKFVRKFNLINRKEMAV